jgi:hypothetical protein
MNLRHFAAYIQHLCLCLDLTDGAGDSHQTRHSHYRPAIRCHSTLSNVLRAAVIGGGRGVLLLARETLATETLSRETLVKETLSREKMAKRRFVGIRWLRRNFVGRPWLRGRSLGRGLLMRHLIGRDLLKRHIVGRR